MRLLWTNISIILPTSFFLCGMPTRPCLKGRCSSFVTQWITGGDAYPWGGPAVEGKEARQGWGLRWLVMDGSGPLLGFCDSKAVLGKGWTTQLFSQMVVEIHTWWWNPVIESVKKNHHLKQINPRLHWNSIYIYIEILNFPPIKNQRNQPGPQLRGKSSLPPSTLEDGISQDQDPVVQKPAMENFGQPGRGINQNPIWMFPKIVGFSPQIIHFFFRVLHDFHHPFWGKTPYFWKHPFFQGDLQ